jgi:uncharacterized membrane protein YeaQ/YmgE (transglycosylase-associated protein family)
MNFIKFIVWLTTGAIVGWFASRMVDNERRHTSEKVILSNRDD